MVKSAVLKVKIKTDTCYKGLSKSPNGEVSSFKGKKSRQTHVIKVYQSHPTVKSAALKVKTNTDTCYKGLSKSPNGEVSSFKGKNKKD